MATSLLVISKTRAERHLTFQPDLQMHEKTFEEKVVAVASHLPIFGLAAVFRIGSLALIFGCLPPVPDSVNSLILFQVVFCLYWNLSVFALSDVQTLIPDRLLCLWLSHVSPPADRLPVVPPTQPSHRLAGLSGSDR